MTDPSSEAKTIEVARQSKRATLASLLTGAVFYAVLFVVLRVVVRSGSVSETLKVMALITAALGVLVFGLAIIGDHFIRKTGWRWASPPFIILWVYVIPTAFFFCMCLAFTITSPDIWTTQTGFFLILVNRIPLLFLWQALMLTWFMLRVKKLNPMQTFPLNKDEIILAGLAGIGLALAAIFVISIQSNLIPSIQPLDRGFPQAAMYLRWVFFLAAISLIPWAEEEFFRGILPDGLSKRLGQTGSIAVAAILFALLQFRLTLFLPALILGLGLSFIRMRSGLKTAVAAHAIFNLVMLGLFSGYMI
jgi:membrane protease YdiL (CAAX protease family)